MIIYNCSKGTEHIVKPKQKGKVNEMNNIFGITVEQMINDRGNGAMNQFVIRDEENSRLAFQSYNSIIAVVDYHEDTITIFPDWDYSTTTGKHRNIFFRDYGGVCPRSAATSSLQPSALKGGDTHFAAICST